MRLTAKQIKDSYDTIKYKATNGKVFLLKQYYPICMGVANSKDTVCLDTGGQMASCDFFVAKIEDSKLFRQDVTNGTKKWKKIATLILEK